MEVEGDNNRLDHGFDPFPSAQHSYEETSFQSLFVEGDALELLLLGSNDSFFDDIGYRCAPVDDN